MPSGARRCIIAACMFAAAQAGALAQEQSAADAASSRSYKQVAVTLPVPVTDPAFSGFRRQLMDIAQRKDRPALGRLVVTQGFFWEREGGNAADESKSGLDNFAAATGLDAPDGSGWDFLADYAAESSASAVGGREDLVCAPAMPSFDESEVIDLLRATDSNPLEWGYPVRDGIEARASATPDAPPVATLGLYFIRVLFDDTSAPDAGDAFLRVLLPSGGIAFVAAGDLAPIGLDQLCYASQDGAWKIAGFVGEGPN
jgi:hypothetical protein